MTSKTYVTGSFSAVCQTARCCGLSSIVITERDDNLNLYVVGQEHKKFLSLDILPMKQQIETK